MKCKLLITLLFTNLFYSQTTHQFDWSMSSTNQQISINTGDTVVWTWGGGTHNLRSTGGVETFDSGYFAGPGPQFSYTFNNPGVTTYICDPHPNSMYGTVTVSGTASLVDPNILNFNLSPNPVKDIAFLTFKNDINQSIKIEIYDILGKLIMKEKSIPLNNKSSLNILGFNKGIYIIKVYYNNSVSVKRFIKE